MNHPIEVRDKLLALKAFTWREMGFTHRVVDVDAPERPLVKELSFFELYSPSTRTISDLLERFKL